jgi:hypothetical protein
MIEFARWFLSNGSHHDFVTEHQKKNLLSVLSCFLQLEDEYSGRQRITNARYKLSEKQQITSQDRLTPELPVAIVQEFHTKPTSPIHEREYNPTSSITEQETTKDHSSSVFPVALVPDYNTKMTQFLPEDETLKDESIPDRDFQF